MDKTSIDYSLYLVTDSTASILRGRDLVRIVKAAIDGGVTIVQYRDKDSDTADLIKTAKKLHEITRAANVPLLINDRVDVALAIGAEGVHIGQDDLDLVTARKLLGDGAIIGVTAATTEEAEAATEAGADYLGIGTVFATPTKEDTKSIIGPRGVRAILNSPILVRSDIRTVCIGGINKSNIQRVLFQAQVSDAIKERKALDGVAVVSAIVASDDPKAAAQHLRKLCRRVPLFERQSLHAHLSTNDMTASLLHKVPAIMETLSEKKPLCHNMTNLVVQNLAANVALCIGGSPIMSNNGLESADLARLGGSLVVNMGTANADAIKNYILAIKAYNDVGGPVVLDPVGAGATQSRQIAVKELMQCGHFDLIKGNEGEIKTVAGVSGDVQQHGVDSGPGTLSLKEKAKLVQNLAATERTVVLMTGAVDVLSNGDVTYTIKNGHPLLGAITGSGCTLGTTAAAYLAVHRQAPLLAVLAAVLHFEIAAERAAQRPEVRGPGSFVAAWLDELYLVREISARGDYEWLKGARVEKV